jgi:hypothetical protein
MVTGGGFPCPARPGRSCPAFRSPADGRSFPDTDTLADTVSISLAEPIRRGEQVIAAIDLTKPKGRALRGLALQDLMRTEIVALLTLIPRISNPPLTAPEVDNLGADDLAEIGGVVRGFFMSPSERKMMTAMMAEFSPKT